MERNSLLEFDVAHQSTPNDLKFRFSSCVYSLYFSIVLSECFIYMRLWFLTGLAPSVEHLVSSSLKVTLSTSIQYLGRRRQPSMQLSDWCEKNYYFNFDCAWNHVSITLNNWSNDTAKNDTQKEWMKMNVKLNENKITLSWFPQYFVPVFFNFLLFVAITKYNTWKMVV